MPQNCGEGLESVETLEGDMKSMTKFFLGNLDEDPWDELLYWNYNLQIQYFFVQENFRHIDYDFNYNLAKVAKEMNVRLYALMSSANADAKSTFLYLQVKGKVGYMWELIFKDY